MKLIHLPQGKGKTTEIFKWLNEDENRILIAFSHHEMTRLIHEANSQVRKHPSRISSTLASRIVDWDWAVGSDRIWGKYQKKNMVFGIDNADMILQNLLPYHRIEIITINKEGVKI